MAARKKKKGFSKVAAVKALARERVGTPPPTQREDPARRSERKREKHKPTLGSLLKDEQ